MHNATHTRACIYTATHCARYMDSESLTAVHWEWDWLSRSQTLLHVLLPLLSWVPAKLYSNPRWAPLGSGLLLRAPSLCHNATSQIIDQKKSNTDVITLASCECKVGYGGSLYAREWDRTAAHTQLWPLLLVSLQPSLKPCVRLKPANKEAGNEPQGSCGSCWHGSHPTAMYSRVEHALLERRLQVHYTDLNFVQFLPR